MIAPNTPQKMPCRRCRRERLRQARAIAIALSPERTMLTKMIVTTATQNCGVVSSAIRVARCRHGQRLENRLQQLAHFGGVAGDLDTAGVHDRKLFLRRAFAAGDDGTGV